jgi:plastocyanin
MKGVPYFSSSSLLSWLSGVDLLLQIRNSVFALVILLISISIVISTGSVFAFHNQYNLPLPSSLEHQPSYAVRIPFGTEEDSTGYEPANISIPAGMTVVWFNDDSTEHTVTPLLKEPPIQERFGSGVIPPGGFSVFMFTKPGIYQYYDEFNPTHRGQINVGDLVAVGNNMDMRLGGDLPFNASELERIVLSFVPKTISLPPSLELTYNVTIFNSTDQIYNREFGDIDGILDLEIIPISKMNSLMQVGPGTNSVRSFSGDNNTNDLQLIANTSLLSSSTIQTTTSGPDLNSPITGTYHIEGPILVEPSSYLIRVEVAEVDNIRPRQPIVDEFMLPTEL